MAKKYHQAMYDNPDEFIRQVEDLTERRNIQLGRLMQDLGYKGGSSTLGHWRRSREVPLTAAWALTGLRYHLGDLTVANPDELVIPVSAAQDLLVAATAAEDWALVSKISGVLAERKR